MAKALRTLGYTVYDCPEAILYHRDAWLDLFEGKRDYSLFKEMYSDIDAVVDLPACILWDQILRVFPTAKVIRDFFWWDLFIAPIWVKSLL